MPLHVDPSILNLHLRTVSNRKAMNDLTKFIEEELGALLRATREDQGLTRKQVAEKLGVSEQEIEMLEKHSGKVTLGLLQKYANLINKKIQLKFL